MKLARCCGVHLAMTFPLHYDDLVVEHGIESIAPFDKSLAALENLGWSLMAPIVKAVATG
jgi:hypothetical protein